MATMILWMALLLIWAYVINRMDLHDHCRNKLTKSAYHAFYVWEDRVMRVALWVVGIGFAVNFVRITPNGIPVWVSYLMITVILVLFSLIYFDKVMVHLYRAVKEPFRRVDKADLKWRVRGHLVQALDVFRIRHDELWGTFKFFVSFARRKVSK